MTLPAPSLPLLLAAALLAGCATVRQTDPPVTATQQLLITAAVDRSVAQLKLDLAPGSKVYLDTQYLDMDPSVLYPKYTIAAVSEKLLSLGGVPVNNRMDAEVVVELRSGAQSIDRESSLVGIPSFSIPVPLAGSLTIPEIPLFKKSQQIGRSKLAVVAYSRDGGIISATGAQHGEARQMSWVLLLVFSGSVNESLPPP